MDQLDREVKRLTLTVEAQSLNRQSENNLIKAVVSDRLLVNLWTGKVAPLGKIASSKGEEDSDLKLIACIACFLSHPHIKRT